MAEPAAIPAELRAALEGRYRLAGVLGRGGMAVVYLADDRKHQRQVAIKVLRPDLAATLGAERFLKEIQIAARLSHPHIMALHDSGEAGGFLYYVMPYIEGASLRQRLEAERRLDFDAAMAIAGPVSDALGYAHRMGVFHRDIKPENILFQQGHPIVGDFGIARALITAGGVNLTRTGFPVGTPGYMSPEQAAGLTDLDERTDVYSLAVVIYEMLVGELPGRWPSEDAVRQGRFLDAPPSHRARLAQVGAAAEGALVRAMAIREEQRTASPATLLAELTGANGEQARSPAVAAPLAPAAAAPPRRKFGSDEALAIVHRAAELEATQPTLDGAMTIGGVEALAAEVGIRPGAVRQAVRIATPAPVPTTGPAVNKRNIWLGGPRLLEFVRVVDGELPVVEFPALVEEIRSTIKNSGLVNQLGPSFSWTTASAGEGGGRDVQIEVTVRQGRTRIAVRENLAYLAGIVFGALGGGGGGGGIGIMMAILTEALAMPQLAIVTVPAWIMLTMSSARSIFYYSAKRRQRELEALADRLAALAAELVPAAATPRLDAASRKLIS